MYLITDIWGLIEICPGVWAQIELEIEEEI